METEKLNRWTDEEIQFIKSNFKKMSQKEIAEKLGRTYPAVTSKIRKLGLIKNPEIGITRSVLKKGDRMTYSDIAWLRERRVSIDRICKATKMDKSEYNEFIKNHSELFQ